MKTAPSPQNRQLSCKKLKPSFVKKNLSYHLKNDTLILGRAKSHAHNTRRSSLVFDLILKNIPIPSQTPMKNLIRTICTVAVIESAIAQTSVDLIDEDFTSATLRTDLRIRTNQANGNFWTHNDPISDWVITGGMLSNAGTSLTGSATEGAVSQVVDTSSLATDLTSLTLSFDYTIGETATLKFALIGYTANVRDGFPESNILMNNGTPNGALQNDTQADEVQGDINLLTGADMSQSITNDLTFASGTSGSHSVTIDLTSYAWHADEAMGADPANTPGLSGSIASIADFDYVVLVAVNDLNSDLGVTPTTLDNIKLISSTAPNTTIPNIISIERDGSGNVVLTLDGPETGLTVQQSDDLSSDFADVASSAGTNTLTIESTDVDPNADGTDFYRIRN